MLVSSGTIAEEIIYDVITGRDFIVGQHGDGGGPFSMLGEIDDVRVFARALTPAEVASL